MAYQTIPNLPAAVGLNGTELIWVVQNGVDVKVSLAALIALASNIANLPVQTGSAAPVPTGELFINTSGYVVQAQ